MTTDDFMALTLDVWEIPPESARRVGHPAPFPVELPEQLIRLYTYADDLVLDPFMGSGSALVAAARLGRRYVGYDLDPTYVDIARRRVAIEGAPVDVSTLLADPVKGAKKLAEETLVAAGFTITARNRRIKRTGAAVSFVAEDSEGHPWVFEVAGAATSHRGGLARTDAVWRTLGRLSAVHDHVPGPLVVLSPQLPRKGSEGDLAFARPGRRRSSTRSTCGCPIRGSGSPRTPPAGTATAPALGFWSAQDLAAPLSG